MMIVLIYNPTTYNGTTWKPKFVHNPEGMMRHYSYEEHYPFYFIKDHLGNIRETYIKPAPNTKYLIQRMQYYPSGIPWKTSTGATEHPYRYNGKELVQMHGQDEYDSKARWYYPAICRTTTMDPLCEKYYNISPYAWCGNNPVNVIDPSGCDTVTVTYNSDTNHWDLGTPIIAKGNDVINVTDKDGNTTSYEFSEGEYGKRINMLNLENTGEREDGYVLGVYHVSGAKEGGTGFYVTPGGNASNDQYSGRRIIEGTYPIVAPFEKARWLFPGVGGEAIVRGCRFHWGDGIAKDWTDGCFILFYNYTLDRAKNICITETNSKIAAINYAHLLGGVGTASSTYKGRTGVLEFPYGIQDKLVLKSIWK